MHIFAHDLKEGIFLIEDMFVYSIAPSFCIFPYASVSQFMTENAMIQVWNEVIFFIKFKREKDDGWGLICFPNPWIPSYQKN